MPPSQLDNNYCLDAHEGKNEVRDWIKQGITEEQPF
jgi:hypothetical protein